MADSDEKLGVIRKEKGEYCVRSPNNPDWNGGCYKSKGEAEKRLKQIEFFKRQSYSYDRRPGYSYDRRGSVGLVTYPSDHVPGMLVPPGGSSCATCKALSQDGRHCANPHFQAWRASLGAADPSLIPAPADEYCSDWYDPVESGV